MKRRIILLGPPGSGKGTIAARLQSELNLSHISSGHLFRQEVEKGSDVGRRAKMFLDNGELVPDDTVLELMERRLEGGALQGGFMLDGFPRNLAQAKVLAGWLAERQQPIEAVVLFDAPEDAIVERISGRRSCAQCGQVYQIHTMPPKVAGVCDGCGSALVQREDDAEETVRKRFGIYQRLTEPLVEYYRQQGKLTVVDAFAPLEQRFAAIFTALGR